MDPSTLTHTPSLTLDFPAGRRGKPALAPTCTNLHLLAFTCTKLQKNKKLEFHQQISRRHHRNYSFHR